MTDEEKKVDATDEATPEVATAIAETAPAETAPAPGAVPDVVWGTGRRKSAVARVRLKPGTGRVLVNG